MTLEPNGAEEPDVTDIKLVHQLEKVRLEAAITRPTTDIGIAQERHRQNFIFLNTGSGTWRMIDMMGNQIGRT